MLKDANDKLKTIVSGLGDDIANVANGVEDAVNKFAQAVNSAASLIGAKPVVPTVDFTQQINEVRNIQLPSGLDADIEKLVKGVATGMNFTWSGQSCGSTSRVFLHESIHDKVLEKVVDYVKKNFKPGVPTDMATTMGPVISKAAEERVLSYIESGKKEGAKVLCGGDKVTGAEDIKGGYFILLDSLSAFIDMSRLRDL